MYELDLKKIGHRIKVERVKKDYSQEDLAEKAETTRHTISMIETGSRDAKILSILKITNALNIDINELLR